ncbi:MAG TPA: M20/M25/M40 family metallo-hydrolase [Pyrinomonadaceae bacterium]|nr:M20/M25/M40 family metallo-hydrolase [Pyrinomonadaceae bacterium]
MKLKLAGIIFLLALTALSATLLHGSPTTSEFARRRIAQLSSQQQLERDIFRELIEINTTHQFGSTKAAEAMAARLRAAGFADSDVQVVGPQPERGNLIARLRGKGKAKPVLFLAHLDVVEARKEDWSPEFDPFKFTERDGYFYGRGTVDVKNEAALLVSNLIRLRRENFVPDRDIIVALTADEEGGEANGVAWLLENRRELIDAAYCINTDAGGGQIEKGKRVRYNVQTSEKASLTFRLEVKNPGGHSSQPIKDNAIYHLAEGLSRLAKFDFPIRLNETTRLFFERMSNRETGQMASDMKAVAGPSPDSGAAARILAASPFYNSMMRTTCVATMLEGGHAPNALPQTARAIVNCRVLPEDSQEAVMKTLVEVLADKQITLTPLNHILSSPASPLTPEVIRPVERLVAEMWPGVPVVPVMDPWATDGLYLRRAGVPVYGTPAVFFDIDPIRAHGKDERVGVRAFYEGGEYMYRLMKALTSAS